MAATDPAGTPTDLLVRLFDLPDATPLRARLAADGVVVRRAMAYEKAAVADWVGRTFGQTAPGWRSECEAAFARLPVACMIAVRAGTIVGFVCHDATARGFLGPIGVSAPDRSTGVGSLLLLSALDAMRSAGYAYAIVGAAGPVEFFVKTVGALPIPGSSPGIYPEALGRD